MAPDRVRRTRFRGRPRPAARSATLWRCRPGAIFPRALCPPTVYSLHALTWRSSQPRCVAENLLAAARCKRFIADSGGLHVRRDTWGTLDAESPTTTSALDRGRSGRRAASLGGGGPSTPGGPHRRALRRVQHTGTAVAKTQYGRVRGYVEDGVLTFKGVPYGASTGATTARCRRSPRPPGRASFLP